MKELFQLLLPPRLQYLSFYNRMDIFTKLFWICFIVFALLSAYLLCCTKKSPMFYVQVAAGCGMFITSKIGRKFLGLE